MIQKKFKSRVIAEFRSAELSVFPNGQYSILLNDGTFTPVCVIPIPLGGRQTKDGKSIFAEVAKDEIIKRWNSFPNLLEALHESVSTIETLMREHNDDSPSYLMSLSQIRKAIEKAK
jgi:hypothetical protein